MTAVVLLVAAFAFVCVVWRYAVRLRSLPCPEWLVPLLENPYMNWVAGSSVVLDRARIGSGMRVLDVGCGPGRLSIPAAERVGPDGEVVALDVQEPMLRRLEDRLRSLELTNIRMVLAGVGDGAIEPGSFDRALLVTVLGEIPNRTEALGEIFEALKPGGILSITEVIPDPHYQRWSSVREMAEEVGFQFDEAFGGLLAYTMNVRSN